MVTDTRSVTHGMDKKDEQSWGKLRGNKYTIKLFSVSMNVQMMMRSMMLTKRLNSLSVDSDNGTAKLIKIISKL